MRLSRSTVGVVVIGLLAVVGLGLTAATVTSTTTTDFGTGGQFEDTSNSGGGDQDPGESQQSPGQNQEGGSNDGINLPDICIEILTQLPAILGLVIGFLAVVAITYRQRGFIAAGFVGYLFGIPLILGYGLVTQCDTGGVGGSGEGGGILSNIPDPGAAAGSSPVPPVVFLAVFAVAAVLAIGVIASAAGREELETEDWEEEEDPGLEEFAAVAGEAADRIESTDASVDNAVYRAWVDMTSLLDVDNPETATAGEFAAAAVDAGMNEADVDELTQLFEEVRYGDMDPQPREELAVSTLRNIESTYGASADDETLDERDIDTTSDDEHDDTDVDDTGGTDE